jgi:hypothetical protein
MTRAPIAVSSLILDCQTFAFELFEGNSSIRTCLTARFQGALIGTEGPEP